MDNRPGIRFKTIFLLLICFLPLAATVATAGNGNISGTVVSAKNKRPLIGATVLLTGLQRGAVTDVRGGFSMANIPSGTHKIRFTYTGYEPVVQTVTVGDNTQESLQIQLEERIIEMDAVVVTGTLAKHKLKDTPVPTELITEQEIRDIGSSSVADILREETGFSIGTTIGQTEGASIHGMNKNHVLILVDGERITGKLDGALDLAQIPVQQIQRIEVVKGPLSSIYGSDALGGVINIITKKSQDNLHLEAGVTGGSNGRQDYTASGSRTFTNALGDGHDISLAAWGSWNRYFGIDYSNADNFSEVPDYDRRSIALKAGYKAGTSFQLDLRGSYYNDEMGWLSGSPLTYVKDEASNKKTDVTATAKYFFSTESFLQFSTAFSENEHRLQEYARTGFRSLDNSTEEKLRTYRLQWTTVPYTNSILSLGTEYLNESIISDRIVDGSRDYESKVLYGENEWTVAGMTFSLGGRYSHNNVYGSFFSPKISFMTTPIENVTLRASYGRGFREPSLKELFIFFANTVGYVVEGEPNLQPEKSSGLTVGLEYTPVSSVWLRVNMYHNNITNLIDYYIKNNTGERAILSYYNISSAVTRGIDADVTFAPSSSMQLKLGYSYTDAKNGNGTALPFRVPHAINFKFATDIEAIDTRLSVFGHWYSNQPVLDDQTNKDIYTGTEAVVYSTLPAFTILNAKVEKQLFGTLRAFVGVTNITDKTMYPFGQTKPREYYAGINFLFQ